jgi:predicted HAD superfamily Cof-like phosphohydrolase
LRDAIHKVRQFHEVFGLAVADMPTGAIPAELRALRIKLLEEELEEYKVASASGDIVAVADALTDLAYVLFGTYVSHGLEGPAEALFDEVHRSNMSKLDENGRPMYREDGKVLKSELFSPPDLAEILASQETDEALPINCQNQHSCVNWKLEARS